MQFNKYLEQKKLSVRLILTDGDIFLSVEITGPRFAGISVGYLQLLGNLAAVAIVPIMEVLRGATGHYVWPLVFLAVLMAVAFMLATRLQETMKQ